MVNVHEFMILIKNRICTTDINSCIYDSNLKKWLVIFKESSKVYSYSRANVKYLKNPKIVDSSKYIIKKDGVKIENILAIEIFSDENRKYWQLTFINGKLEVWKESELEIIKLLSKKRKTSSVFEYLKEIAGLNDLLSEDGDKLLVGQYEKINISNEKTILSTYLSPQGKSLKRIEGEKAPIFPFGGNLSQYRAVLNALENSISVIQGPPGTGKTQTILNIIANLLLEGKTVQIVSNNNFATENILEKLKREECGLDFLVANLGNRINKESFIKKQSGKYPDFSLWQVNLKEKVSREEIKEASEQIKFSYKWQEDLATLQQKISEVELEKNILKNIEKIGNLLNLNYKETLKRLQS